VTESLLLSMFEPFLLPLRYMRTIFDTLEARVLGALFALRHDELSLRIGPCQWGRGIGLLPAWEQAFFF